MLPATLSTKQRISLSNTHEKQPADRNYNASLSLSAINI